jgi:hypothetical protein
MINNSMPQVDGNNHKDEFNETSHELMKRNQPSLYTIDT